MIPTEKITAGHLRRNAYLYIRQSTAFQVEQNRESTQRQYGFQDQAIALGWHPDQVVVIDDDLGQSGAEAADRAGFQRLVADVGLKQVGIVLSLEVSRLARNSSDWHRLLELCALTETLILDEDGLYDPNQFNDRLILGLRGTMSEAELHFLRVRLEGGKLNKARRGELRTNLPAGLVYDADGRTTLDPDRQVQRAIHDVFGRFQRTQSAWQVVPQLRERELRLPVRLRAGPRAGEMAWVDATLSRVLSILKNPRYAGMYFYGRTCQRKGLRNGTLPPEQWKVRLPGAHPGYITWDQYESNLRILGVNDPGARSTAVRTPPREGPALLQGILLCGRCGRRMTVRYHRRRHGKVSLLYYCQREATEHGGLLCQHVPGWGVDQAIGELLTQAMVPEAVGVAMEVYEELRRRIEEVGSLYRCQVERTRHEAELAEHQFLLVNPENRLVADTLELRWNEKLRALADAEEAWARWKAANDAPLAPQACEEILGLVRDFPAVWNHPRITPRDRKRMLRLLIEDVTLTRQDDIRVEVRWKGGATAELHLPIPRNAFEARRTSPEVLDQITILARDHTDEQIAGILNEQGTRTGTRRPFTGERVHFLRRDRGIPGYYQHLRRAGLVTGEEIRGRTGIAEGTLRKLRRAGLVRAIRCDRKHWLYENSNEELIRQYTRQRQGAGGEANESESRARGAV
jgi:DNA invertase Pin-like site-specific DNA recombinase